MSEQPPMTRAEGWLRTVLWVLPSVYATLVACFGRRLPTRMFLWSDQTLDRTRLFIVSTVLLTIVTGWIWSLFKAESPNSPLGRHWTEMAVWTLWFCVIQALIVPVIASAAAIAACFLPR